jgi:predicted MPP superfamily phosphohydrolase
MEEIDIIKKEVEEWKKKNGELEERLKKYTNGDNHKRYYEKNKEKVMELGANYLQKLKEENPEKLKEYRRTYYLKKKNEKLNSNKIDIKL